MDKEHVDWRPTGLQIKDKPPDDLYKGKKAVKKLVHVLFYDIFVRYFGMISQ